MYKQGNIVILNNNKKYAIVDSRIVNNSNYLCLVDQSDFFNIMFYENNDNKLNEVTDPNLLSKLILTFNQKTANNYGYSAVTLLSIMTALISIGILILGILLTH